MYQVYTHPKYIEHGKKFFEGVNERYTAYARLLEPKIGIPYSVITPLIFIFVRACVHYAMFEDEYYLHSQLEVLKQGVALFAKKNIKNRWRKGNEKKIWRVAARALHGAFACCRRRRSRRMGLRAPRCGRTVSAIEGDFAVKLSDMNTNHYQTYRCSGCANTFLANQGAAAPRRHGDLHRRGQM